MSLNWVVFAGLVREVLQIESPCMRRSITKLVSLDDKSSQLNSTSVPISLAFRFAGAIGVELPPPLLVLVIETTEV